jgi:hypothetical protein
MLAKEVFARENLQQAYSEQELAAATKLPL